MDPGALQSLEYFTQGDHKKSKRNHDGIITRKDLIAESRQRNRYRDIDERSMSTSKLELFKTNPGATASNHGGKVIYMRKLNNKTINDKEHLISPYHDQRS